jgi:hypothetical protein
LGKDEIFEARAHIIESTRKYLSEEDGIQYINPNGKICAAQKLEVEYRYFQNPNLLRRLNSTNFDELCDPIA